jgi:small subunit ribosomal protein S20
MPHHKSNIKRLRQAEGLRVYNRTVRTRVRNAVKAVRGASLEEASAKLTQAYSVIDVAVKKGVLTRPYASRVKSRLAKHTQRLSAS